MMQKLMTLTRMGVAFSWALAIAGGFGIVSHHEASAAGIGRSASTISASFKHGEDDGSGGDANDDNGGDTGGGEVDDSGNDS